MNTVKCMNSLSITGADLGGFGGGSGTPPRCQKKFFFALKIPKRNKACAVHCTVTR